jgi:hypothetical protein
VLRTSLKANAWYLVIDAVTERWPVLSRVMILVLSTRSHAGWVHAVTLEATEESLALFSRSMAFAP